MATQLPYHDKCVVKAPLWNFGNWNLILIEDDYFAPQFHSTVAYLDESYMWSLDVWGICGPRVAAQCLLRLPINVLKLSAGIRWRSRGASCLRQIGIAAAPGLV